MNYVELDIEIGELFSKLGLPDKTYNTNIYSEVDIQVKTPLNEWVSINSFVKKEQLPMIKLTLSNGVSMKVAKGHILQENGNDVFAANAKYVDTLNGTFKVISKEEFGTHDAYDVSIPYPHLYLDSENVIHHNTASIQQACAKAKREMVHFNVTNETSEEDLIGSFILDNGNMVWKDGPVLIAMRRGAVLLLDEIDQLNSSCMALQSILQNEPYYIKKTNELVSPSKGFTIVGTANTKGDGDGGDRFIGANVLNEAFLERFNVIYEQQYPPLNVEMKILQNYSSDNKFCAKLVRWSNMIRKSYYDGSIPRCLTTRRLIQIVNNVKVLQNEKDAIDFALNRFETHVHDAMIGFYESMSSQPYNDGLDELAGTAPIISDETKILFNKFNNYNAGKLLDEDKDEDNDEFVKSLAKKHLSNSPSKDEILKELQSNSNYI